MPRLGTRKLHYMLQKQGISLSRNLESEGSLTALELALADNTASLHGLIHHSDRGVQYCCKEYMKLLKSNCIRISMTENGDPYENALAERVNGILKDEWLSLEQFHSFEQVEERINQIINIYNEIRPHLSCGMKTPAKKHKQKLSHKFI